MDDKNLSDAELERYFSDRAARHGASGNGTDVPTAPPPPVSVPGGDGASTPPPRSTDVPSEDEVNERTSIVMKRILMGLGIFAGLILLVLLWFSRDIPSFERIENPRNLLATVVYSADGVELARYYEGENRTWVPLDSISQHVVNALIATEDRRFYQHWGVDARGFVAVAIGAATGKGVRGASTITMQLARNLFNEDINFEIGDRSPVRKVKEILTAIRIERTYTKDEIVEAYLNTVPFRYNAYGIEAASQTYFNKPALDLNPEESATLVGMLAANTRYDPVRNPTNSRERRNVVLASMVRENYLEQSYYDDVRADSIALEFKAYSHEDNLAPHFAEYLRLWFRDWAGRNGYDPYADGLVIHTTIDSEMQELATEAVREQMEGLQAVVNAEWGRPAAVGLGSTPAPYLRRMARGDIVPFGTWWDRNASLVNVFIAETERFRLTRNRGLERDEAIAELRQNQDFMDSLRTAKTRLEAGLVAVDPNTGYVRAWVGGVDFRADKYDHVAQARRQPGSTFKPFAYTAAFDNGYSPRYYILDAPFSWAGWRPQNSGGTSGGYVTMQQGLAYSKNIVAARVTRMVGPQEVARYAQRLGIRSPLDMTPNDPNDEPAYPNSIALGVQDVTLLEMASAYATLADYGIYHEPTFVTRIEDRYGNVVARFEPAGREVLNASTAYTTVDVMRDVIRTGTAKGLRSRFDIDGIELAGKTGTTQNSGRGSGGSDGWFIGMNPDLVVGAWVGFNDRQITFRSSTWGQGARTGMLLVGDFLENLQNDGSERIRLDPSNDFEQPPNYRPPSRRGYEGGGGPRRRGSGDPNLNSDRPARDLLERWRQREQQSEGGEAGRIGW